MFVANYLDSLDELKVDEETNIRILRLTHDETYSLYLAEITKGTTLPAHFHNNGVETYQILRGQGEFELGTVLNDNVVWKHRTSVKPGDCFCIQPQDVHRLTSIGNENLQILFFAPPAHLSVDRFFTG